MALHFMVWDAGRFHEELCPNLAASWVQNSFAPCRPLCAAVLRRLEEKEVRQPLGTALTDSLTAQVPAGLAFDPAFWPILAGELLILGAESFPWLEVSPGTWTRLLAPTAPKGDRPGHEAALIQQACFGTRDLLFGGKYYRPLQAGYNDTTDVKRLAGSLEAVDPRSWALSQLQGSQDNMSLEDLEDELEVAREWFPALQDLYVGAARLGQVVVCENP